MDSKNNEVLEALLSDLEAIDAQMKAAAIEETEEKASDAEEMDEQMEDATEETEAAVEEEGAEEEAEGESVKEKSGEEVVVEEKAASDDDDDDDDTPAEEAAEAAEDAAEAVGDVEAAEEADAAEDAAEAASDDDDDDEEMIGAKKVLNLPETEESEEDTEEKGMGLIRRRQELLAELARINNLLEGDTEVDSDELERKRRLRTARLMAMGWDEDDIKSLVDDPIFCAAERKVLAGSEPCGFCRGGCAAEKGLPGLLDIEAIAMEEFKGEILDSGYAPNDDLFVVDVKTADGRTIEAFYDGAGTSAGWVLLDQELVNQTSEKSELAGRKVISMTEAEELALKSFDGVVMGVDASIFEGYDAWAVQIESLDGKSFDVYVGLDGTTLGYDEYDAPVIPSDLTPEEVEEIKSLEGELALKRAFSAEQREELAKQGHALPDGSFPIVSVEDLKNAIQAYGRASNREIAKAHIMKRAAQLGHEDLIPEAWTGEGAEEKIENPSEFVKDLLDFQALAAELDLE